MRIAQFTNTYHPSISGVVRSVAGFRQALTELGNNVFVFTQDAADYEDQEPFIFRYISLNLGLPNQFPATIPISPFMDRLIPALKLDVIHAHHPILLGQIAANKAQELNIPLVFTFHTRYREYSHYIPIPQDAVQDFLKGAIDLWLKDFIKQCDQIVVPSESMRQVLAEHYDYTDDLTVVPTGIDLRPYGSADGESIRAQHGWQDDIIIVSVGRLASEKNWPTLLEAVAKVHPKHPKLRLVIIGDGPDSRKLKKMPKKLGIADRVNFLGKLPFDAIPSYLKASNLFAFASTTETQGLVTLEAMAAGLPVVAVDAIGTRDVVVHEKDGLLTEDDSAALAAAIDRMLSDPNLLEHYRAASLEKAKSLEFSRQAKKLVKVYEEVIERKKRANK
ncbi:MAG: glycosyltransferase family 4 protein [Chloroflexi bacterium]|nr:glycosyltransferase family 4 protein [Chloroflexota bacterium]